LATIPGAPVIAAHFGETMVLYSEGERVEAVVDGAPPGDTGRLFVVEPGKPKKVPYEAGRFMLDHLGYTGVVRVNVTESDSGTTYDIANAKVESIAKLAQGDEMRFKYWLAGVVDDYVKRNKPVPQPEESIMRIIERRGYDLKNYGIVPIGWAEKEKGGEMDALRAQVAELTAKLNALTKGKSKDATPAV
jgi:hypothetical protein